MPMIAPYGTWKSPISTAHAAAAGGGPDWVDIYNGEVWWADARPEQGGRVTIMRGRPGGQPTEVLSAPWNARNRVHEYGGRPFRLIGPTLVFTNWDDQRLYRLDADQLRPTPITPAPERKHGLRYAVPTAAAGRDEVWCIRETITGDRPADVERALVAVPLDGAAADDPNRVRVLASSHRFLTEPKISPDGRQLAWIGWDHPAMPWDGTELCVAAINADGSIAPHRVLAGGPTEAVCQLEWDGDNAVLAITDPDGWWNLYRITMDGRRRNLAPMADELGGALWRPGMSWFAPLGAGRHAVLRAGRLAVLDEASATVTDVDTELAAWSSALAADRGMVADAAAGPHREFAVVAADLSTTRTTADVKIVELTPQPSYLPDKAYLPTPAERTFPGADGTPIPAIVYSPTNPDFTAGDDERPPYLVHVHGGPTGRNSLSLDLEIAFFTSRGFGVVAPNYGGSTGYGRAFRDRLRGQWGVVDVEDCAAVATALAAAGEADPNRLVIRGGSAGGWTTAASLTSVTSYRCGTAMYPILDLSTWTEEGGETHDFESHYLYGLVGPLPAARQRYLERSPASRPDRLSGPILLLQGTDDPICPPAPAERFVRSLAGTGIRHAYLAFDGEQHGFRKAETIEAALNAELSFYGQVLGFEPADVPRLELSS